MNRETRRRLASLHRKRAELDLEIANTLDADLSEAGATAYSSTSLPPATSRRTFHEVCRSGVVAGAEKAGRTWSCPLESWHAARARRPLGADAPARRSTPEDRREKADELIAAAGFRFTGWGSR